MAASAAKLEEEERERKREAIRARIAAQRAAKCEDEPGAAVVSAKNGGQEEVKSAATEEKERKREEIRQRIAAQKAAEEAEQRRLAGKAERERENVELQNLIDQMGQASLHGNRFSDGDGRGVHVHPDAADCTSCALIVDVIAIAGGTQASAGTQTKLRLHGRPRCLGAGERGIQPRRRLIFGPHLSPTAASNA